MMSAALLLEHNGFPAKAAAIHAAALADLASRGNVQRSTTEVGDAIVGLLSA
jgi:3-isopropylmalate dehydrogenase